MRNYIYILGFIFSASYLSSQDYVDVLKVSCNTTPYNTFDSSDAKTRVNELVADLTIPVKINDRLSFISGVIYENIQTKLFSESPVKSFGSTTIKIGVSNQFNDRWSGTLVLLPKIASDYKTTQRNDFQFGGIGILKFKKRENLLYKVGLYFNTELFGPFFVPMLGLYYLSPNKKFETNLMLPLQADMNYKLLPFLNAGLNFNGQIRSYHLTEVSPGHKNTYLAKSTNELYLYLKFNVTKNLSIYTKVGQSVGRSYRVYEKGDGVDFGLPATFIGGHRKQLNSDFSDGLIFQVALLYRFNLNK